MGHPVGYGVRMKVVHVSPPDGSPRGLGAVRLHDALRRLGHDSTILVLSRPGPGLARQLPPCDVLNLHDVIETIDYHRFFRGLPKDVPVVWRLTDVSAFALGPLRKPWVRMQRGLQHVTGRLHLVAPTGDVAERAHQTPLLAPFAVSVIPDDANPVEVHPQDEKPFATREYSCAAVQARHYESLYKCLLPGGRWSPFDAPA